VCRTGDFISLRELTLAAKGAAEKPMAKSEIYAKIAEKTELSKKDVAKVFDELSALVGDSLGKKGPKVFTIPGLLKITVVNKPATKARKGINPFTKEEVMIKAKPARNVVKVRALKALKDMA
jgi:nucleoid DNA-binding protein